jgi:hypothetical protein
VHAAILLMVLACAACTASSDSDAVADSTSASTTAPVPLAARIELDSLSLVAGDPVEGEVIVVNNTGNTVRAQGCGGLFQVALSNEEHEPAVAWQDCLEDFLIPMGESTYPVTVNTVHVEPGSYEATLYQRNRVVPDPEPIEVEVTE